MMKLAVFGSGLWHSSKQDLGRKQEASGLALIQTDRVGMVVSWFHYQPNSIRDMNRQRRNVVRLNWKVMFAEVNWKIGLTWWQVNSCEFLVTITGYMEVIAWIGILGVNFSQLLVAVGLFNGCDKNVSAMKQRYRFSSSSSITAVLLSFRKLQGYKQLVGYNSIRGKVLSNGGT